YVRRDKVPSVLRGRGLAIISTSKGIVTDDEARKLGLGGEVLETSSQWAICSSSK
ncbi:MAG: 30S ribosomal protein S8, partial [Chloroflexi bacterium]|nr:30S ribosomal protein S8 [Chloroflexota bacterium]